MNIFDTSREIFDSDDSTVSSIDSEPLDSSQTSTDLTSGSGSENSDMQGTTSHSEDTYQSSSSSESFADTAPLSESSSNQMDGSENTSDNATNVGSDIEQEDSFNTAHSSDTEAYDVDAEMERLNEEVIEINDSQMPDDDDVILIPQNIETIDLCTQAAPVPLRLRNEVIDITNSPAVEVSRAGPIRRRHSRRSAQADYQISLDQYPEPATTSIPRKLDLNDSANDSQPKVTLTCPICLDSVVNRQPVSTICGHLFCKICITQALQNAKKCPMCKKALGGRKPYFEIFLPC